MMKKNLRNAALLTILSVVISSCSFLPTPTSSETARDQERKANDQGSFFSGKDESGIKLDELFNLVAKCGRRFADQRAFMAGGFGHCIGHAAG